MKKVVVGLFFILLSTEVFGYTESDKQPLFEKNGKTYYLNDLSFSLRNILYESEYKNYQLVSSVFDEALLTRHFEKIASSKKITVEQAAEKELKVSDPTDREIKKYYESQKASIPSNYGYDQIKPYLKNILIREKMIEKRNNLVAKLKKQSKFKSLVPTPLAPYLEIDTTGFPSKGNSKSKITLVEFGAYTCVHCKHFNDIVKQVLKKDNILFVFIPSPLSSSPVEADLIKAGFCAGEQGKFWDYFDVAYENQRTLSEDSIKDFGKKLKLDMPKYETCVKSSKAEEFMTKVNEATSKAVISATPTIFINGKKYPGGPDVKLLEEAIEDAAKNVGKK